VHRWIEQHVQVAGAIEQAHLRPWATALRVPTPDGTVWFKAAQEELQFEARVLDVLVPLAPDLLPEVIASRPDTGWLLLRDAGVQARDDAIDWAPLLDRYACLQVAAAPRVGDLLAAGALDNRPAVLADQVERLLPHLSAGTASRVRARLPELRDDLAHLAASTLPPTIDHNDLHDRNVFVLDGHVRVLDWGDAAVAHPFMTLSVEEAEAARPSYLAHFPGHDDELAIVLRHRILFRALGWLRIVHHDPITYAAEIEQRVALWLEGRELSAVRLSEGADFR
jgi:Phosphotransferase enzyme family